jgi:hypothetical protein
LNLGKTELGREEENRGLLLYEIHHIQQVEGEEVVAEAIRLFSNILPSMRSPEKSTHFSQTG